MHFAKLLTAMKLPRWSGRFARRSWRLPQSSLDLFSNEPRMLSDDDPQEEESQAIEAEDRPPVVEDHASLATTRDELTGLMEKVRLVSRQFHKG